LRGRGYWNGTHSHIFQKPKSLILRNKIIPAVIGKISYANTSGILADFRHIHPQNKGIIMTNNKHIDITKKDTFEQSVYAQFPACLHQHVEHELFYNGVELEEGQLTIEEFAKGVVDMARYHEQWQAQLEQNKVIFAGIKKLIDDGAFKDASMVAELEGELERGEESLLARFIEAQPVKNSLDAALSFFAWKYTKALVEMEAEFNICLDGFREAKEPEFFCTSESNMSLINFSVMS